MLQKARKEKRLAEGQVIHTESFDENHLRVNIEISL
jgi:hypothetical protein